MVSAMPTGEFGSVIDSDSADPSSSPNNTSTTDDQTQRSEEQAHQVLVEQQVLARLETQPCEFIVRIAGIASTGESISSFVAQNDDMLPFPMAVLPIPPPSAQSIVVSVCCALGHLHQLGIIHRDVKPDNLLLSPEGHVDKVKLTGLTYASSQPSAHSLVGTPEFMAPEMIMGTAYTAAVDWWALGCLTSELLTGQTPFAVVNGSVPDLLYKIFYDEIVVPTHDHIGPQEREFIAALLQRDQSMRLGIHGRTQVLAHPWFGGATTPAVEIAS